MDHPKDHSLFGLGLPGFMLYNIYIIQIYSIYEPDSQKQLNPIADGPSLILVFLYCYIYI